MAAFEMPMLICCYDLALNNMNINKAAKKLSENMGGQTINDDFKAKIRNCARNVYLTTDYSECFKDQGLKLKGVYGDSDPKDNCCSRVINYICMKTQGYFIVCYYHILNLIGKLIGKIIVLNDY